MKKTISHDQNITNIYAKSTSVLAINNDMTNNKSLDSLNCNRNTKKFNSQHYSVTCCSTYRIKDDHVCSGDSFKYDYTSNNQFYMILSDGMGSGNNSFHRSLKTIKITSQMLKMGFATETIAKSINKFLIHDNIDEIFTTLDLVLIDLSTLNFEFIKACANPTYVIHNDNSIETILSQSVPVGIIKDIEFGVIANQFRDDDIIIMCTDGVENPQSLWIEKYLLRNDLRRIECEDMIEILIKEACVVNKSISDDMTILISKIIVNTNSK